MRARRLAELLAVLALAPGAASACDLSGLGAPIRDGAVTLAFRAEPPLAVGGTHALVIGLCGLAKLTGVDAFMPAHGHGTNYRTEIAGGPERWRADGLILHMPGRWEIRFEIETPEGRRRLVQEIELE